MDGRGGSGRRYCPEESRGVEQQKCGNPDLRHRQYTPRNIFMPR